MIIINTECKKAYTCKTPFLASEIEPKKKAFFADRKWYDMATGIKSSIMGGAVPEAEYEFHSLPFEYNSERSDK